MSEIDLAVFDMAGTTVRDSDHVPTVMSETLGALGLPVSAAEIDAVRGASKRDAIQELLLRYSPEQATTETVDRLFATFKMKLAARQQREGVRAVEGAEEVFRWLRAREIKVALTTGFDRATMGRLTIDLGWKTGVVDAMVSGDDVKLGRPAPYLIFHAMEATGVSSVHRVAVLGDTMLDLQAGANAGVAMNVGVLSGAHSLEQLETAPHTHLIDSVRKFPQMLA